MSKIPTKQLMRYGKVLLATVTAIAAVVELKDSVKSVQSPKSDPTDVDPAPEA